MAFEQPHESRELVEGQLQRLLASRGFAQSRRLSRFLSLLVEKSFSSEPDLSEYALGVAVFDRDQSFDPRIDPIVRVNAHKLRDKLKKYYDGEGVRDAVEISLPRRGYLPAIQVRATQANPAIVECAEAPRAARSLAVLPIATLSVDKQDEHFAAGLTEELIHALVKIPDLRVVALAGNPAGARPELGELAREHHLHAVLVGSVRRREALVRVSVQLVSGSDSSVVWSTMLEPVDESAIAAQERMAKVVSDAVCARMESKAAGGFA